MAMRVLLASGSKEHHLSAFSATVRRPFISSLLSDFTSTAVRIQRGNRALDSEEGRLCGSRIKLQAMQSLLLSGDLAIASHLPSTAGCASALTRVRWSVTLPQG